MGKSAAAVGDTVGGVASATPLPAALPGPVTGNVELEPMLANPLPVTAVGKNPAPSEAAVEVDGVVVNEAPDAVAFTLLVAEPKVIEVDAVYSPAGSPTLPNAGTGMVGSPGMNGTSN